MSFKSFLEANEDIQEKILGKLDFISLCQMGKTSRSFFKTIHDKNILELRYKYVCDRSCLVRAIFEGTSNHFVQQFRGVELKFGCFDVFHNDEEVRQACLTLWDDIQKILPDNTLTYSCDEDGKIFINSGHKKLSEQNDVLERERDHQEYWEKHHMNYVRNKKIMAAICRFVQKITLDDQVISVPLLRWRKEKLPALKQRGLTWFDLLKWETCQVLDDSIYLYDSFHVDFLVMARTIIFQKETWTDTELKRKKKESETVVLKVIENDKSYPLSQQRLHQQKAKKRVRLFTYPKKVHLNLCAGRNEKRKIVTKSQFHRSLRLE
jgi:hypothetical protein